MSVYHIRYILNVNGSEAFSEFALKNLSSNQITKCDIYDIYYSLN